MGCLTASCFNPFEVRDDSNPSGDGLSHLNQIKLGGAATNAITFIPGKELIFGSFNFITGIDGRLHVSNLETTRTGQIISDSASHNITRSSSESDSCRLKNRITLPRYLFRFCNSSNTYQYMLARLWNPNPNTRCTRAKDKAKWMMSSTRLTTSSEWSTSSS